MLDSRAGRKRVVADSAAGLSGVLKFLFVRGGRAVSFSVYLRYVSAVFRILRSLEVNVTF